MREPIQVGNFGDGHVLCRNITGLNSVYIFVPCGRFATRLQPSESSTFSIEYTRLAGGGGDGGAGSRIIVQAKPAKMPGNFARPQRSAFLRGSSATVRSHAE